jgi:hypothetical protein
VSTTWSAPTTAIGWLAVRLTGREVTRIRRDGVLVVTGPGVSRLFDRLNPRLRIGAMTLGDVILARDDETVAEHWSHELVHVGQARRWGPMFLPAYGIASVVALLTGHDAYLGNFFEVEARRLGAA